MTLSPVAFTGGIAAEQRNILYIHDRSYILPPPSPPVTRMFAKVENVVFALLREAGEVF